MNMKVILLREIQNLGKSGDVKQVSDGYARNFLLPRGLAELATGTNMKTLSQRLAALASRDTKERAHYNELVEKLAATPLRFTLKVGTKGQAFGSVSVQDISEELSKHGITVEKGWIELEQGIKAPGEHIVKIRFPHQIGTEVKVTVEAEK